MSIDAPRLLSRSCTTGWLDWVWGDLWLTDDALYRVSRGMAETRTAARARPRGGSTVPDSDAMAPEALDEEVLADAKNRRAPLTEIRSAKLRRGLLNGRLSLVLDDGTRIKLLWLKSDPAHDILAEVLQDHL
jgi:hypothetical protein